TRRSLSHSSRAARTCGTRRRVAAITSASPAVEVEGDGCVTMLAPGLVHPAGRLHAAWSHSINRRLYRRAWGGARRAAEPKNPSTHVANRAVCASLGCYRCQMGMDARMVP